MCIRDRAEGDGFMYPHVKAVALKHRVGLDRDMHDHIARRAAVGTGIALAAQCDVLIIVDAGGDAHLQRLAGTGLAGAAAGVAGILDCLLYTSRCV